MDQLFANVKSRFPEGNMEILQMAQIFSANNINVYNNYKSTKIGVSNILLI